MEERKVIVKNESGLHARPAAQLSNFVKAFEGSVTVASGERTGDAKSILNLLSMGIKRDSEIILQVTGENECEFANSLVEFIENLEG